MSDNGLFDNLKSLFVESVDDGKADAPKQDAPVAGKSEVQAQNANAGVSEPAQRQQASGADQKMVDDLTAAALRVKTPFVAFQAGLATMSAVEGMDEVMRYRAAFAMHKGAGGGDVAGLVQGLEVHEQTLENEVTRFHGDAKARVDGVLAKVQGDIAALGDGEAAALSRIEALKAEMARLQESVDEGRKSVLGIQTESSLEISKMDEVVRRFDMAAGEVRARLASDRQKITSYLK